MKRLAVVLAISVLVAVQAIRSAIVEAYADSDPDKAAGVWPNHPDVIVSGALTDIGAAAAVAKAPPQAALDALLIAAKLSPLSAEPFLARGIEANQAGNRALARNAFLAARNRDPREAGPRFLLAEDYLEKGEGDRGLSELAVLARLLPNGNVSVAPALASFATTTSDARALRAAFRANPGLEQAVLGELAKDPRNERLAVSLAGSLRAPDGSVRPWVQTLINRLVESGDFKRARSLWSRAGGIAVSQGLFDPQFGGSNAPAPFNWAFNSDSKGFAEPDKAGGLHVVFYGREDSILVSQTILLGPGRYRLGWNAAGVGIGSLEWSVICMPSKELLQALPLAGSAHQQSSDLTVGTNCPAQQLNLLGSAPELPRQTDATIRGLTLTRIADGR